MPWAIGYLLGASSLTHGVITVLARDTSYCPEILLSPVPAGAPPQVMT